MNKFLKVLLAVGGAITALGVLLAGTTVALGAYGVITPLEETYDARVYTNDTSYTKLDIKLDNMDVMIIPSQVNYTRVEYHESEYLRYSISIVDDTFKLRLRDESTWFMKCVQLDDKELPVKIYIPQKEYEMLTLENQSGDINISEHSMWFDTTDIKTASGCVEMISANLGFLNIVSSSGDIKLDGCIVEEADIKANSGDITIEAPDANGDLNISTDSGKVYIEGVNSEYADMVIDVKSGDVDLENSKVETLCINGDSSEIDIIDTHSMGEAEVITKSGDIDITNFSCSKPVYMETQSGSVKGTVASAFVFDAETKSGDLFVARTRGEGSLFTVRTQSGDINLVPIRGLNPLV